MIWIQLFFFFAPVAYIWWYYGVQKSISASYYELQKTSVITFIPKAIGVKKYTDDSWLFILFAAGTGIPMWFYALWKPDLQITTHVLIAFSGLFMTNIAVAGEFRLSKALNIIHYLSATFAIAFAFTAIWYESGDFLSPIIFLVASAGLKWGVRVKNFTWWVEIFAFLFIIIRLAAL
jgi:hypothetical protein